MSQHLVSKYKPWNAAFFLRPFCADFIVLNRSLSGLTQLATMSRGGSGSANNIPLGNRPPGAGTTFGKAPLNDGGSLLKPAYLQQQNGSSAFGQPPPPPPAGVKRPNMELIASLNKALGHTPGSNPPPMVGPGPSEVEDIAAAAAAAAKIAAAKAAAAAQADKNDGAPDRKRKRKSRWGGGESDKTFIPGIPTMIPSNLSKEQEEIYLRKCLSLNYHSPPIFYSD